MNDQQQNQQQANPQDQSVNIDEVNAELQALTKRTASLEEVILVPDTKEVHRTQLKTFMESRNGIFMGIDFTKLDGSPRKLLGRLGVRSPLKGGTNKTEALDRPYLVIYDVQAQGYRTVNLATVSRIRVDRCVYDVID
jgi:hypothetical protein